MPELPEVEQVRASIERRAVGLRVQSVTVHRRDVVCGPEDPSGGWSRAGREYLGRAKPRVPKSLLLQGDVIRSVLRHGKQLGVIGDSGAIGFHLGMTGQFLYRRPGERLVKSDHVHVTWTLVDPQGEAAGRLVFRDPRRFGGVWAYRDRKGLSERWESLGPDALTIEACELAERLRPSTGQSRGVRHVKAALLDQSTIAGVGNIYADESLFRSGILPTRPVGDLSDAEVGRLAGAIREILAEAVESGGSTLRDYVDGDGSAGSFQQRHRVYGRSGQLCITCGNPLRDGTVAQRMTVWCVCCQR
ncbi:MAG: DNA-formamidopyrimidine glycosylase family protein [Phycisphaerales bacterium JB050]